MKKLLLMIPIALCLFIMTYSVSDNAGNAVLYDLTGLEQLETKASYDKLSVASAEALDILYGQEKNIKALDSHIYYGNLNFTDIDCREIRKLITWKSSYREHSPLFESTFFEGYYKERNGKIIAEYQKDGILDINKVVADNKTVLNSSMVGYASTEAKNKEMLLLLQYKLLEKLAYEKPADKERYITELLSMRKPDKTNAARRQEYLYQLFESRARLKMLEYAIDRNRLVISDKLKGIGVKLIAKSPYALTLDNTYYDAHIGKKPTAARKLELYTDKDGYWTILSLADIISFNTENRLIAVDTNGKTVSVLTTDIIQQITLDEKQQLCFELDSLIHGTSNTAANLKQEAYGDSDSIKAELRKQCNMYNKSAAQLTRELNKFTIYLKESGNKKSRYVSDFEKNKKSWQTALNNSLNSIDHSGSKPLLKLSEFVVLNKRLADFYEHNEEVVKYDSELLNYREKALQFRNLTEGTLWLLDMTYELWSRSEIK